MQHERALLGMTTMRIGSIHSSAKSTIVRRAGDTELSIIMHKEGRMWKSYRRQFDGVKSGGSKHFLGQIKCKSDPLQHMRTTPYRVYRHHSLAQSTFRWRAACAMSDDTRHSSIRILMPSVTPTMTAHDVPGILRVCAVVIPGHAVVSIYS